MRCILALSLLAAAALAQQPPREPELPAFHAQSKLVILPFQISRNKHFATDLTSDDVVLLEDGVPRKFSVFEGPQDHTPVELLLLFDTTSWPMGGGWNLQTLYGFTARWSQSNASALVADGVQAVRASMYHFDGVRLERLCQPAEDPTRLVDAFRHLLDPIRGLGLTPNQRTQIAIAMEAADSNDRKALEARFRTTDPTPPLGTPIPLDLPPGSSVLPAAGWPGTGNRGWPLEAAIGALKDATADGGKALRVLVEFSQGTGGTSTSAEDVADIALSLGVSVYPVVLNYRPVWFTNPQPTGRGGRRGDEDSEPAREPRQGIRHVDSAQDNFARLGSLTGGRSFTPKELNAEVAEILDAIRKETLDRARSQYTVGFTPQSSEGQAREHKLEVKLAAKSTGKVSGGKRKVIY